MSFVVTDYSFGEFVLDNEQRILLREGKPVALAPKVFDTLLMLVENSGRIVTKQELMNRVWPDTFVEEDNLTYNIKQLRKTFGDDARNPLYIETIARRGYRFIAAVKPGETKQPADNKLELIANPQQQSYGELFTQTGFLHRVDDAENQTSTGAVALADWRRKTSTNGSEESAVAVTPVTPTGKVANLEIVRPAPGKRATYLYGLAGVIGLVLLAGIGYGIYRFGRATTNPAVSSLKTTRLTSNGKTKTAAVSPEGKFVAYVLEDKDEQSLWLKNIPTGSDVQILVPAKKTAIGPITISRDGNFVFYGSSDGTTQAIFQLPVLGGMPKKVLANYSGPISFSPDGKQFAFIRYSSGGEETAAIVIVNSDGSDERVIASSKRPAIFLRSAAWSPDGKIIACAALNPSGQQEVVAVRVADGIVSPVPSPRWRVIWEIVWRPDGESLLVTAADSSSSNQIWSVPFPSGQARRITNDSSDYRSISLPSDSSAIVAVREQQEAHLWIMPSEDTARVKQLTSGFEKLDGVYALQWTNDNKIIFENAPSGRAAVWTINPDGDGLKEISAESGEPALSPDGRFLVYQTRDSAGTGLFRLSLADGEKKRLTTGLDLNVAFSPDAKWVVFTRYSDDVALWRIPIDGGEPIKLIKIDSAYALVPTVSPDGKLIAFHLRRNSRGQLPEIALIPFDGGEIIRILETPKRNWNLFGKNTLQWAPNGQAIFFTAERDDVSNIWRIPLDGSPAVQVTNFASGLIFNFAYSRDGKQLALSRGTFNRDVILISQSE